MKRSFLPFCLIGLTGIAVCLLMACNKKEVVANDVFNTGSNERNLIVVISDLHLGADISYAETNANLAPLANFLEQVRASRNVKELVIAGDMIDEWFVPAKTDTYHGKDQADFVDRVVETNKDVFGRFNGIIKDGKILVTYLPGNHDLTITAENISKIFPGINQARDNGLLGLGTYSPADYPEIAIEHGHRYNFFCAPDPVSNQDAAPGTILPPGYFFTRIAAQHVIEDCHENTDEIPTVTPNVSGDESQTLLYKYYLVWAWTMEQLPIEDHFDEKIIITNVDGFIGDYSVNDLFPYQTTEGGVIEVNLFNGIQDTWAHRCALNNVAVSVPTDDAIMQAASVAGTDTMAVIQYFMNPNSDKRLVVFGHTHEAKIKTYENHNGQKAIYANSGTWIDHNPGRTTMNFIIITQQNNDGNSQTYVKLYNFENQIITEMAQDSLRL